MALIYYEMMFGQTPWLAKSQYELVTNIMTKPVEFPEDKAVISEKSKDFIRQCLAIEEERRISWDQIYQHPLFEGYF
jgi:serine/threonine protein kinase